MPETANRIVVAPSKVWESRHLPFATDRVWDHIRPLNFSFSSIVKDVKVQGAEAEVGSQRTVNYKDGTSTTLKLLALDDLSHSLTYELIAATPALTVSSAVHTIKLYPVTFDGTTLIYWSTDYSNDATQEVIQDSKYKKQEYFADLLQALGQNKKHKAAAAPVGSPKKAKK